LVRLFVPQHISVYLHKTWHLLTEPSVKVQSLYQRRQAQFLAALLTLIVPVVLVTGFIHNLTTHQNILTFNGEFSITMIALAAGLIAYTLSRTRYHSFAAHVVVVGGALSVLSSLFPGSNLDETALGFLILPILLSSLLLSVRWTLFYIMLQMVAVIVLASGRSEADWAYVLIPNLRFELLSGLMILLGTYFRNQIADDQNRIIQESEATLKQANGELEVKVAERMRVYEIATEELMGVIAEREAYERELAKERNLLRTVIDNVPDHIFVLDRDGKYILINHALEESYLRTKPESLLGKGVFDYFPKEQAIAYHAMEQEIMSSGRAVLNIEQSSNLQGEEQRHYLTSKLPLRDDNSVVIGMVGIARDVTEHKRSEQLVQQSFADLERRVAERTAELSHTNSLLREQIADREQVEAELRYHASLLENVSEAIISVDYQFTVRSWNKAAERMYGWAETEAIGRNAFELTGSEITPEKIDDIMHHVLTSGDWHGEMVDTRRDGTKLNVIAAASLIKDSTDHITGMVLVHRDMTERKRVEAAANEQRALAEALRDTAAAINSTLNISEILDSLLVYVERVLPYDAASIMLLEGDAARVMHGRGFAERGLKTEEVVTLRFPLNKHANLREMAATGRPIIISDTTTYPNWRVEIVTNWIRSYIGAPIQIEGKVIGFINLDSAVINTFDQSHAHKLLAFADQAGIAIRNANLFEAITLHATEMEARVMVRTAELVNERAQLQAIMDSMNEGVFGVLFGEKPVRYANCSFQRLTGYEAHEWSYELMRPQKPDEVSDFVQDLDAVYDSLSSGMMWEGRGPVRRKDGVIFDAHMILTRIDNHDGSPIGTVTILRDVSQEKALEQQKSLFVANASHELRTPITNLTTRLYLIRRQPEALETHLQVLDEVARRMRTLVEDLLDHSRFERGVIPLEPKLMDIRGLVSQVVNLQVPEADKKHINLLSTLPDTPLMSMVDPERMIQVITNLTMNAIHYTPEGGQVSASTELVTAQNGEEHIRLTIQDTGIGVPAALLPNLFKPFFRVSEKTKGTGLGLSIARDIVRAHKGDITVESVPGVGSRFIVDIPAAVKAP